VNEATTNNKQ
jgi:hypothetical protein